MSTSNNSVPLPEMASIPQKPTMPGTFPADINLESPKEDATATMTQDMDKVAISVTSPENKLSKKWTTTTLAIDPKPKPEYRGPVGTQTRPFDSYVEHTFLKKPMVSMICVEWCDHYHPESKELCLQKLVQLFQRLRNRNPTWKPIYGYTRPYDGSLQLYSDCEPVQGDELADGMIRVLQYQYHGQKSFKDYETGDSCLVGQWQSVIPSNKLAQEDLDIINYDDGKLQPLTEDDEEKRVEKKNEEEEKEE
ncbi:hypothetical protein BO94DRAFT_586924 [Aspergillus sclerotioniger CBS 115572]|uniref:Uncharacterized protein n=1 Tax=Aspergillus sclerotioniger CBS 115572 TaxID=1450535 RepID=A0A317WCC3_9EURO|nr:hypothetical protein BO94DRAFT_586924 [Aspergillus sclerotioniger CBS 115572]PWY83879.1 hypothetical protein BO94DRAFT_586924 [Aspergillus sclerotioniger CBS 115572]